MREVGAPAWDEADRALAAQFAATLSAGERADNLASTLSATDLPLSHYAGKDLDDGIAPFFYDPKTAEPGSTDVGDVSYCAPTAQCYYAAGALGTGGHTWQMAAQSCSPLGFKGMLAAAAAMAHATPTSPWQPTSAPEMEELVLATLPKSPAVASARRIRFSLKPFDVLRWYSTAGSTPQEPHVGAVTIRPPEAFSSDTASA